MIGTEPRAQRSSQSGRVLAVKDEVIQLLTLGYAMGLTKDRVGLQDMPLNTFYHHAKRLRDEAKIAPYGASPSGEAKRPERNVSKEPPTRKDEGKASPPLIEKPITETQPRDAADEEEKRASNTPAHPPGTVEPEKPSGYDPKKRQPKIRKSVQVGVEPPVDESKGVNPKKWKKLEI